MIRIFRMLLRGMLLIVFLPIAVTAYSYPTVGLYSERTDFLVGDAFAVRVLAFDVTDVGLDLGQDVVLGFGFDVHYPGRDLAFTGAAMGPGIEDASGLLPGNRVAGIASPLDADALFGERILLATLDFECLSVGRFLLGIASDPDDMNGGLFTLLHQEGIFDCLEVNVAPVPIPLPHFLLASGMIALAFCRWARRES